MKVTIFLLCLNAGGAERVSVHLAHHWLSQGKDVEMVTVVGDDWPPRYELDSQIRHVKLDLFGDSSNPVEGVVNNIRRLTALREVLKESRPDVVVGQLNREIVLAELATRGLDIPVVGHHHSETDPLDDHPVWDWLTRWAYAQTDRMVFLTEETVDGFGPAIRFNGVAIPNPVEPPPSPPAEYQTELPQPCIACVAGLRAVKNHELLVEAFASLADRFPDWHLVIVGEGPRRSAIEARVDETGLAHRIHLTGYIPDQYDALHQADVFALPSDWEGFSMSLCEALSCGLPVITTDSSPGQRLIVRDEVDGLLVPPRDTQALADALERLMADADLRERMGKHAAEVVDRFSRQSVFQQWDALLEDVTTRS